MNDHTYAHLVYACETTSQLETLVQLRDRLVDYLTPKDPTRGELLEHIRRTAMVSLGGDDLDDWALEEAAYLVAEHCHKGQGSNLYAALCASPFRPGAGSVEHGELYDDAANWVMGLGIDGGESVGDEVTS